MSRELVKVAIEDELFKTSEVSYNDYAGLCGIAMFRAALHTLKDVGYELVGFNIGGQQTSINNCIVCQLKTKPAKRWVFSIDESRYNQVKGVLLSSGYFYLHNWSYSKHYLQRIISQLRREFLKDNKTITPEYGARGRAAIGYKLVQLSGGNKKPSV